MRQDEAIGVLSVARMVAGAYSDREIALVEAFADQAVIAIENARLFEDLQRSNRQLTEALEQQTATAQVLRVIASSPTSLESVLDTLVTSAIRLCGAGAGGIQQLRDGFMVPMALSPAWFRQRWEAQQARGSRPPPLIPTTLSGRAMLDRRTINTPDVRAAIETEFPDSRPTYELHRHDSQVVVPLMSNDEPLGVISLFRFEEQPFTDAEVAMAETFADQAVIAIENARLFEELQQRTNDLTQALEQQTATAEILRVIASSPADLPRVLETIAESVARFCGTEDGLISRVVGDHLEFVPTMGRSSRPGLRRSRAGMSPAAPSSNGEASWSRTGPRRQRRSGPRRSSLLATGGS